MRSKLVYAVVIASMVASTAFAAVTKASAICPKIGHGSGQVVNYGNILAGVGIVKIEGQRDMFPYFNGYALPGLNIPQNLSNYDHDGVDYNPLNGAIICKYKSHAGAEDAFAISYLIANASGGVVSYATKEKIYFKLRVGEN